MSLYLDLLPAPQFDRSLVSYTVGNFQRIKDLLVRASGRVYIVSAQLVGPWPSTATMAIPFKCDILYSASITFWGTVTALLAMTANYDGAPQIYLEQWFNETGSHKSMTAFTVIRGVTQGSHTFGASAGTGGIGSDSNDRFKFGLTCVEV